jgi:hypothetical protein
VPGFGRNPARTTSLGSRSSSFTSAAGQPGIAAAAADALASFPPPRSPTPPGAAAADALPSPPVEADGEAEQGGRLLESLSNASLVSLSSDGSFAPTLAALVEGAAPQAPPGAAAQQAAAAAAPPPPAEPTSPRGAPPAAAAPGSPPSPVPRGRPLLARRSPLLSTGSRGAAKLESLGALLSRQPVAHVRLAPPPPATSKGALGWLSPGKAPNAAAAGGGSSTAKPAAAAAAAAAVAAAGVEAAGPGVALPLGGLQRSNSDPSMASSLGRTPLQPTGEPGPAAGSPPARRVTFNGAATVLGPRPGSAAVAGGASGGLLRHRTAPSATLSELAGELASVALFPGEASSRPGQQLLLMEPPPDPGASSSLTFGGLRRPASYHSLAGLNLEGAAAAEEQRIKQQRAGGCLGGGAEGELVLQGCAAGAGGRFWVAGVRAPSSPQPASFPASLQCDFDRHGSKHALLAPFPRFLPCLQQRPSLQQPSPRAASASPASPACAPLAAALTVTAVMAAAAWPAPRPSQAPRRTSSAPPCWAPAPRLAAPATAAAPPSRCP